MITKKLAFGFIAIVAFATPAAAQQAQTSVQSANTQNAAVNGSSAFSNTELNNQQIQLEREGFYGDAYEGQNQLSVQESNTSNAAVNGSSAFSNTELNSQQVQFDSKGYYPHYPLGH
ncbi:MAG: hypothetical protein GVY17_00355 [Cyanobacteria bacterium]|jgi:hypothetical protein|nr:hypothetical protein [Cyanobacteria bacterium GSL.Bin21]